VPSPVAIRLRVNDAAWSGTIDPWTTLLELLRVELGLTGTNRGCDRGECGTCVVLVDGRPVPSCLTLALSIDGAAVTTIEGLASDESLHPVQQAFVDHDALQCGFCTPGQILAGAACIAAGRAGSDRDIREWMSGQLCRCAAYPQIVAAIRSAAKSG